jgi:CBS domain-containing protein
MSETTPLIDSGLPLRPLPTAPRLAWKRAVPAAVPVRVADVLRSLGWHLDHLLLALDEERRRAVLAAAPVEEGRQWARNFTYPDDCVGRLMEPPQAVFGPQLTVAETTARIRELVKTTFVTYGFVTDDSGVLLGVVTMRDLLLAEDQATLESIMLRDPFALPPELPLVEAARQVVARHFPVYPVCDARAPGRTVRGSTLFEEQALEISAQAGSMVGVEKEERLATPWPRSLRFRHPWLQLNLLTAFAAAAVVGVFQGTIDRLVVLAVSTVGGIGQHRPGARCDLRASRSASAPRTRAAWWRGWPARLPNGARRRDRRPGHAARGPRPGRAAGARARPDGLRRHGRELRRERTGRSAHPAHAPPLRGRPGDRLEHLPDDRDGRREHGAVPVARDARRALTSVRALSAEARPSHCQPRAGAAGPSAPRPDPRRCR